MGLWLPLALVLLAAAAIVSAMQRALAMALLCAGVACSVAPAAWAVLH